jgi:hypothetical protein
MVSPDTPRSSRSPAKTKLSENEISLRHTLKSAPQDLWLDTLRRAQEPAHDGLVYWMLNQAECDFAVAVHAFYRSKPASFLDNPKPLPLRPGPSDIFALILLNWDTGSYRTHRLLVDPVDAKPRTIARINQKVMAHPRGSLPFKIPKEFLQPNGGTAMRVPTHLQPDETPHLWLLYRELGLDVDPHPPGFARKIARAKSLFEKFRPGGKRA